jgi:membrane carboxypeptidase/penicillin-binding protein
MSIVKSPIGRCGLITQQVARLLFLQQEYMEGGIFVRSSLRGKERKIKEWLLALSSRSVSRRLERPREPEPVFKPFVYAAAIGRAGHQVLAP